MTSVRLPGGRDRLVQLTSGDFLYAPAGKVIPRDFTGQICRIWVRYPDEWHLMMLNSSTPLTGHEPKDHLDHLQALEIIMTAETL